MRTLFAELLMEAAVTVISMVVLVAIVAYVIAVGFVAPLFLWAWLLCPLNASVFEPMGYGWAYAFRASSFMAVHGPAMLFAFRSADRFVSWPHEGGCEWFEGGIVIGACELAVGVPVLAVCAVAYLMTG